MWDVMHPLPNLECVSLSEVTNGRKRKEKIGEMTPPPIDENTVQFLCNFIRLSSDLCFDLNLEKKNIGCNIGSYYKVFISNPVS